MIDSVVILSGHPWNGTPYGLHHLARAFADRGSRVLFVEPPFSPLHLTAGRRRGRKISRSIRPSGEAGISLFSPFTLLPHANLPILRHRFFLDHWARFAVPGIASALRGTVFASPALVLSGSSLFSRIAFSMDGVRAYRFADDESLFSTVSPAMRERTKQDMPKFDLVFATTRILSETALSEGARKVVSLPNGIDLGRFLPAGPRAVPPDIESIPRPRAIYIGSTAAWFDWQTLEAGAKALPHVSFVMLSDTRIAPATLPPNVHLLGWKRHEQVADYLLQSDVGIIPFKADDNRNAIAAIDPLKLWEYLGAGLPVVVTADISSPELPDVVFAYRHAGGFAAAIDSALSAGRSPPGETIAADRSWRAILDRALDEAGL